MARLEIRQAVYQPITAADLSDRHKGHGSIVKLGRARTIILHIYENGEPFDELELELQHFSDGRWNALLEDQLELTNIQPSDIHQIFRTMGYSRTRYRVVKCATHQPDDPTLPDAHPFGCLDDGPLAPLQTIRE